MSGPEDMYVPQFVWYFIGFLASFAFLFFFFASYQTQLILLSWGLLFCFGQYCFSRSVCFTCLPCWQAFPVFFLSEFSVTIMLGELFTFLGFLFSGLTGCQVARAKYLAYKEGSS